jgi:hypothetical protein
VLFEPHGAAGHHPKDNRWKTLREEAWCETRHAATGTVALPKHSSLGRWSTGNVGDPQTEMPPVQAQLQE